MRRLTLGFGFSLLMLMTASPIGAGELLNRFWLDYHRNKAWPQPFNCVDRQATGAPFAIMVNNGWRLHNTLSAQLFDGETQHLTRAGELRVRWIATQAPTHRRAIFVLKGDTPAVTQARVEAVQLALEKIDAPRPQLMITDIDHFGSSGAYFDKVGRQYQDTIPAPRLPEMEQASNN